MTLILTTYYFWETVGKTFRVGEAWKKTVSESAHWPLTLFAPSRLLFPAKMTEQTPKSRFGLQWTKTITYTVVRFAVCNPRLGAAFLGVWLLALVGRGKHQIHLLIESVIAVNQRQNSQRSSHSRNMNQNVAKDWTALQSYDGSPKTFLLANVVCLIRKVANSFLELWNGNYVAVQHAKRWKATHIRLAPCCGRNTHWTVVERCEVNSSWTNGSAWATAKDWNETVLSENWLHSNLEYAREREGF